MEPTSPYFLDADSTQGPHGANSYALPVEENQAFPSEDEEMPDASDGDRPEYGSIKSRLRKADKSYTRAQPAPVLPSKPDSSGKKGR